MRLYPCGGMSLYLCGGMTLYLCGEQKNGVGCVPLELLHQFISLGQAFHGAIQSHDFVALSHTTHSMPVTHNALCACHTQRTVPFTHSDSACHTQHIQGLCTQCCSCLTIYACAHTYTLTYTHTQYLSHATDSGSLHVMLLLPHYMNPYIHTQCSCKSIPFKPFSHTA